MVRNPEDKITKRPSTLFSTLRSDDTVKRFLETCNYYVRETKASSRIYTGSSRPLKGVLRDSETRGRNAADEGETGNANPSAPV